MSFLWDLPDCPDPGRIKERDSQGVSPLLAIQGEEQLLDEASRLLDTPGCPSAVPGQSLFINARQDDIFGGVSEPRLHQLPSLCLSQSLDIFRAPCKDARGQPAKEEGIQLMRVGGAPEGKPSHKVPYVEM